MRNKKVHQNLHQMNWLIRNDHSERFSDRKEGPQVAKYIVKMVDAVTNAILDTMDDEVFDTEEAAEEYACECGGGFAEGAEVLELAGRAYTPRNEVDFIVEEIE